MKSDGSRELFCICCCTRFDYHPKYVNGDPRNIAYIGKIVYTLVSIKMLCLYVYGSLKGDHIDSIK